MEILHYLLAVVGPSILLMFLFLALFLAIVLVTAPNAGIKIIPLILKAMAILCCLHFAALLIYFSLKG